MSYLLDANVFMEAKNRHYGFDFCPAFWDWLISMNAADEVFSIDKVASEIENGNDELATWVKQDGKALFRKTEAGLAPQLATVSTWANSQAYRQGAIGEFLSKADYFLVAHALGYGFTVVGHEVPSASNRIIKIPDACKGLGIHYISPFDMLRAEHARFVLDGTKVGGFLAT